MFTEKRKRQSRIRQKKNHIRKQLGIAKKLLYIYNGRPSIVEEPHRLAKRHALNCGSSKCCMCGNPRKFFGEVTMQEKRIALYDENEWFDNALEEL